MGLSYPVTWRLVAALGLHPTLALPGPIRYPVTWRLVAALGLHPTSLVPVLLPAWLTTRDRDILADVRARLDTAGVFAAIVSSRPGEDAHTAIGDRPLVSVAPVSATENTLWDDGEEPLRTFKFAVTITVGAQEPLDRQTILDQLGNSVANAVVGQSLAAVTIPSWTKPDSQQYGPTTQPDQTLALTFVCTYFVVAGQRDTTE